MPLAALGGAPIADAPADHLRASDVERHEVSELCSRQSAEGRRDHGRTRRAGEQHAASPRMPRPLRRSSSTGRRSASAARPPPLGRSAPPRGAPPGHSALAPPRVCVPTPLVARVRAAHVVPFSRRARRCLVAPPFQPPPLPFRPSGAVGRREPARTGGHLGRTAGPNRHLRRCAGRSATAGGPGGLTGPSARGLLAAPRRRVARGSLRPCGHGTEGARALTVALAVGNTGPPPVAPAGRHCA